MSTAIDRAAGSAAAKVIAKLGHPATYTRPGASSYDPATGAVTTGSATTVTVKCVVEAYPTRLVDGTTIRQTDRKLTFAAQSLGITPVPGDTITIGANTFTVHYVEPVYSGEDAAIFTVQGRI